MTSTFLSIDWDFFPFNGNHLGRVDLPDGSTTHSLALYDWSHNEGYAGTLQSLLWQARYYGFHALGLDVHDYAGINVRRGCIPPTDFRADVMKRYDLGPLRPYHVADSHMHAYHSLMEWDQPQGQVIHFDAHHDLGYNDRNLRSHTRKGILDCSDWLYHALRMKVVAQATIVYPPWRGMGEWESAQEHSWVRKLVKTGRVQAMTYAQWQESAPRLTVTGMFLARSSAWVPPWLDLSFRAFANSWNEPGRCLDCDRTYIGSHGGQDACVPRPWDAAEAEAHARREVEQWATLRQAQECQPA